jgi:hypothetical protein
MSVLRRGGFASWLLSPLAREHLGLLERPSRLKNNGEQPRHPVVT